MKIRHATVEDALEVSALIKSVAHYFTLHPQGLGAEAFLKTIEPNAICECITASNFSYHVALFNNQLAGVVAVRDASHLYHLFVAQPFQGQGLSRALWSHAKDAAISVGRQHRFTVNSTPYAVPIYERFGFGVTGPRVEVHGIAFVPMELHIPVTHDVKTITGSA